MATKTSGKRRRVDRRRRGEDRCAGAGGREASFYEAWAATRAVGCAALAAVQAAGWAAQQAEAAERVADLAGPWDEDLYLGEEREDMYLGEEREDMYLGF